MPFIAFPCPHCARATRVPADFAGGRGRCPGCLEWVDAPASPGDGAAAPDAAADETPDLRPCPLCGEPIRTAARKCRHCGEFIDGGGQERLIRVGGRRRVAPRADLGGLPFASPGRRLAGFAVDDVLLRWVPFWTLVGLGLGGVGTFRGAGEEVFVIAAVAWHLLQAGAQAALLTWRDQTLGKLLLGMRIVRSDDGGRPGFLRVVVLRRWLPGLVEVPALHWLALFATGFDGLFGLFGAERAALHDLVAETRVVRIAPGD